MSVAGAIVTLDSALQFDHVVGETARIITAKVTADYTNAIAALLQDETKTIVVCETNDDATASAINTMCNNSASQYNTPCVYFR